MVCWYLQNKKARGEVNEDKKTKGIKKSFWVIFGIEDWLSKVGADTQSRVINFDFKEHRQKVQLRRIKSAKKLAASFLSSFSAKTPPDGSAHREKKKEKDQARAIYQSVSLMQKWPRSKRHSCQ